VLLAANVAQAQSRWKDAARLYRNFLDAGPNPEQAEQALYRLAQCLRWGRLAGVEEVIAEYLRRFPRGPHVKEMRQWSEQP
jgi:TolA-binding protein